MKPLRQTSFAGPTDPTAEAGNCWATCIAMIIEEQADAVPNFSMSHGPPKMVWWSDARRWLRHGGVDIANYTELGPDEVWPADPPRYVIALGQSPRGDWEHAIVWDREESRFYDPHPSDAGLAGEPTSYDVICFPYDPDPDTEAAEMLARELAP